MLFVGVHAAACHVVPCVQVAHVWQEVSAVLVHAAAAYDPAGQDEHPLQVMSLLAEQGARRVRPAGHDGEHASQVRSAVGVNGADSYCPVRHVDAVPHCRSVVAVGLAVSNWLAVHVDTAEQEMLDVNDAN